MPISLTAKCNADMLHAAFEKVQLMQQEGNFTTFIIDVEMF